MTKAETVYTRVNKMVEAGATKADAFKTLAEEFGQPVNSVRGSYYQGSRIAGDEIGTTPRTRRRETTPAAALADARAVFERALAAIDREVDAAKVRADESKAEYDAMKASAKDRKDAITAQMGQLDQMEQLL